MAGAPLLEPNDEWHMAPRHISLETLVCIANTADDTLPAVGD